MHVEWNRQAERLFGWTAEEIKGHQVTALLYRDATAFETAQKELIEKGSWSGEIRQLTKAGHEVVVSSRWTLVRDEEDHPSAVLAINGNPIPDDIKTILLRGLSLDAAKRPSDVVAYRIY